jgi:hypothetical protein
MSRIILICALVSILGVPAKADETLKYRFVAHTSWVQSEPAAVPDVSNHLMGANRQVGIVFYQDGSVGTGVTTGIFDAVVGSEGIAYSYTTFTFADGSELWFKNTGTFKFDAKGKLALKGTSTLIGGKGRYVGAKGDATWEGEQTQAAATAAQPGEAIAYVDGVANIKK